MSRRITDEGREHHNVTVALLHTVIASPDFSRESDIVVTGKSSFLFCSSASFLKVLLYLPVPGKINPTFLVVLVSRDKIP